MKNEMLSWLLIEKCNSGLSLKAKKICFFVLLFLIVSVLALFTNDAKAVCAGPNRTCEGKIERCKSSTASEPIRIEKCINDKVVTNGKRNIGKSGVSYESIPLLFIVVGFEGQAGSGTEVSYNDNYNWGEKIFSGSSSLMKYYKDMSLGKFTFDPCAETSAYGGNNSNIKDNKNDGIVHVSIPAGHDDWRWLEYEEYGDGYLARQMEKQHTDSFLKAMGEALEYSKKHVSFSKYDTNNNGIIEKTELAICFCLAGYEASNSANFSEGKEKYVWAGAMDRKSANIQLPQIEGCDLDSVITMGEQFDKEEDYRQQHIGTIAHELGHHLGLMDYYDVHGTTVSEWQNYTSSCLSLMDSGSWGKDKSGDFLPYSLDAWSKYYLGWIKPQIANYYRGEGVWSVNGNSNDYKTLLIETNNRNEYYLLENRRFKDWDYGLKNENIKGNSKGGIILWHFDKRIYEKYKGDNEINVQTHRPALVPLIGEVSDKRHDFLGDKIECVESEYSIAGLNAIFDNDFWNKKYRKTLGNKLDLPVYGSGKNADRRSDRYLSGIRVRFISNSSDNMKVSLSYLKNEQMAKSVYRKGEMTLNWNHIDGADRYVIYMAKGNGNYKHMKTVRLSSAQKRMNISKIKKKLVWKKKGLKKNKIYRFKVVSEYRIGLGTSSMGKKSKNIVKSKTDGYSKGYKKLRESKRLKLFTETKKSKYTNPKSLKGVKRIMTVKKGKRKRIKCKIVKFSKSKKLIKGASKASFISTDNMTAKIDKTGRITAVKKGRCRIYVVAANGIWQSVDVVVK